MTDRIRHGAKVSVLDAASEVLLLPFSTGRLVWPQDQRVLFLRAKAGVPLGSLPSVSMIFEQSFKPFADELLAAGFRIAESDEFSCAGFPLVLVLPPRQREESRALLARALQCVSPGGLVVACMLNNEGARSGEADLERLAGSVQSLSKNKCRVFWSVATPENVNTALVEEWAALDAPRPIADGRFLSRPGLFAWSRIDAASALLARCFPDDLVGYGADLGAGFGYLAAEVLAHCPGVTALDLYEAESRALALARRNLQGYANSIQLNFYWHDVTTGLGQSPRYNFIVSNPPFHQGRADQPEIGCSFIAAAAAALLPGGRLLLVANRHLPYEQVLLKHFRKVNLVIEEHGFKVIEAFKGSGKVGKGKDKVEAKP